jgi:hypothetical protein
MLGKSCFRFNDLQSVVKVDSKSGSCEIEGEIVWAKKCGRHGVVGSE